MRPGGTGASGRAVAARDNGGDPGAPPMKRALAASTASVATAVLFAACLDGCGDDDAGRAPAGDAPRDTLVIALPQEPRNLLYPVSQATVEGVVIPNFAAELTDADFDCRVVHRPYLAESWDVGDDGKSVRVTLREGMTWQDGQPIGADDVAFTMDLLADPAVASPRGSNLAHMDPEARPRVIDDRHLEFRFTQALDPVTMVGHTSAPLAPKHLLGAADRATLREHPQNTGIPLASGPWKVTAREEGRLVLEPNEAWKGPAELRPKLARVVFKVLPDYATRLVELQNGSVDLVDGLLVADVERLATSNPEIRVYRRGWRQMDWIAWNQVDPADWKRLADAAPPGQRPDPHAVAPHPIFGDRELRRALAMAIDVDELVRDLLSSSVTGEVYGRPAVGTITPALCGAHNDAIKRFPHDPAAARARLAELGWTDTNADGVLDKDGVPLRFTMLSNAGNPRRAAAATMIQQQLAEVGVDARLEQLETNAFFDRLRRRDFEAALAGWTAALTVDPTVNYGPDSEFNFVTYLNPKVDELLARGIAEPDEARANAIWRELQQVVYDDQPYAFLYWQDDLVGVHNRFQDVEIDILAPYRKLWRWSVPPEKVKYK